MRKRKQQRPSMAVQALFDVEDADASSASSSPAAEADTTANSEEEATQEEGEGQGDDLQPTGTAQEAEPEEQGRPTASAAPAPADDAERPGVPPARKDRTVMDSVALVFLEDAVARRLAVAWPVCEGNEEEWFEAAGFTSKQRDEARRVGRALRMHGICRDGGVTDDLALNYIQAVIARPLKASAPKKP